MAYAAMNGAFGLGKSIRLFLNGVCRHEQKDGSLKLKAQFLNGVCRHERHQH